MKAGQWSPATAYGKDRDHKGGEGIPVVDADLANFLEADNSSDMEINRAVVNKAVLWSGFEGEENIGST